MASLVTDNNDTTTTATTTTRRRTTTTANSDLSHFEDLPGVLQICISRYFNDDTLSMINMFAKTSTTFLEYDHPLRCYYFKVVLAKKYGGAPFVLVNGAKHGILTLSDTKILVIVLFFSFYFNFLARKGRNVN